MPDLSSSVKTANVTLPTKSEQYIATAAKGGGVLLGGKLFTYGARFVTGLILARFLAAEQYGLYNLGQTAVELCAGIASLGLATALVRYVPIYASRKDQARLWGLIQVSTGIPVLFSIVLSMGLYFLADPIAEHLFNEPKLAPLLQLASLVVPIFTLADMLAAATRGFKNMHYTVIAQDIVNSIVKFLLIVGLIIFGLNALRTMTAVGLTEIVVCSLLLYFLNKQFPLFRPWRAAQREAGEFLRFSLPVYASSLITTFSSNIKGILLGSLHSVSSVGIFVVAAQVTSLSDLFHSSIVTVSMPIVSELHNRGDMEQLKRFYQIMTRWSFTLNLPLFLLVVLFPGPIIALFGKSFAEGVIVLRILGWAALVNTGTGICGVLLDMSGNTQLKLINTITTVIVTIALNILLIPGWGLLGAAVASLAAGVIVNLLRLGEVFFMFRLLPYDISFAKPITAGLAALFVSWAARHWLPPQGILYLAIHILILVTVYISVILLLGLSQDDQMVLVRLRQRLKPGLGRSRIS